MVFRLAELSIGVEVERGRGSVLKAEECITIQSSDVQTRTGCKFFLKKRKVRGIYMIATTELVLRRAKT